MTAPELGHISEVVDGLAKTTALRDITWQLKIATVVTFAGAAVMAKFDGDGVNGEAFQAVPMISLIDSVSVGDRVAVLSVPPSGNYIIRNGSAGNAPSQNSTFVTPDIQDHNTSSYVDIIASGVAATFQFVKHRDDSRIAVHWSSGGYAGAANCVTENALLINGFDYPTSIYLHNSASARHDAWSANFHIPLEDQPVIPAGEYTVTLRWRMPSGGSTINMDAFDRTTCLLVEAPPA